MNTLLRTFATFAAGAAVMYYLDPATGRRRRALARDKSVAARHDIEDFARAKSRHAANRMQGALARTRTKLASMPVDDDRLHGQIRARLGHLADHPGAVEVGVHEGHVVLRGNAATEEIDALVAAVSTLRGVRSLDAQLFPTPAEPMRAHAEQQAQR